VTKLLENDVPRSRRSRFTFVMTRSDSAVWSSVMITSTFGRDAALPADGLASELGAADATGASTAPTRSPARAARLIMQSVRPAGKGSVNSG
jgi:hypothetical protein